MKKEECIFCDIVRGKIKADIVYSDDNFIVINDINPIAPGHCLIIPKSHYMTILDMPATLGTEIIALAKKQGLRLINEKKAEGFNLVQSNFKAANQEVFHIHFHLIPRNFGDNIHFFSK